jgi:hypothetical protein
MNDMNEHTWKTFRTWSNCGYLIIKGSKGTKINGYYQFNETQVKKKEIPGDSAYSSRGFDDQEFDNGCYGGDPSDYGDS